MKIVSLATSPKSSRLRRVSFKAGAVPVPRSQPHSGKKWRRIGLLSGVLSTLLGLWGVIPVGRNMYHWHTHPTNILNTNASNNAELEQKVDAFLKEVPVVYLKEKEGCNTQRMEDFKPIANPSPELREKARSIARVVVQALYYKDAEWLNKVKKRLQIQVFDTPQYWACESSDGKYWIKGHARLHLIPERKQGKNFVSLAVASQTPNGEFNVYSVHELAHVLDALNKEGQVEAVFDGYLPFWTQEQRDRFDQLREAEIPRLVKGNSSLRRYALTNKAEFLAVCAETYFYSPAIMQSKNPELFELMHESFNNPHLDVNLKRGLLALLALIGGGITLTLSARAMVKASRKPKLILSVPKFTPEQT